MRFRQSVKSIRARYNITCFTRTSLAFFRNKRWTWEWSYPVSRLAPHRAVLSGLREYICRPGLGIKRRDFCIYRGGSFFLLRIIMTFVAIALPLAVYCAVSLLWRILRHILLRKQTCVLDLKQLGLSRNATQKIHGTAVICGGR